MTIKEKCGLFFDVDGVFHEHPYPDQNEYLKTLQGLFQGTTPPYDKHIRSITASHLFNKVALKVIEDLIDKIENELQLETWIILASNWRQDRSVKDLKMVYFKPHKHFAEHLQDKTIDKLPKDELRKICPEANHPNGECRGAEIQFYLNGNPNIAYSLAIDDQDKHHSIILGKRFIKVDPKEQFTERLAQKCFKRVKKQVALSKDSAGI